ncbi:TadE family type IV pilus minor pilin [Arthrobacter sp. JSM 101049]|uniref:TadE family type IV pilus minor pilin n=1 Tax=Arthrobacter sp. JSM 101049 TaxID=929097 RepID=UPI003563585C
MATRSQGGSSTAEFAVLLPAVAALMALVLGAGVCGMTQVRLEQAARATAREIARGEPTASAVQAGQRLAGEDARFRVGAAGTYRRVEVSIPITLPWFGGPELLVLTARAEARPEDAGTGRTGGHAP